MLLLHRPEETGTSDRLDILIAKRRNGPTGEISVRFIKELMRVEDLIADAALAPSPAEGNASAHLDRLYHPAVLRSLSACGLLFPGRAAQQGMAMADDPLCGRSARAGGKGSQAKRRVSRYRSVAD